METGFFFFKKKHRRSDFYRMIKDTNNIDTSIVDYCFQFLDLPFARTTLTLFVHFRARSYALQIIVIFFFRCRLLLLSVLL